MVLQFQAYEDLPSYPLLSTPSMRYDKSGKCTYASFNVDGESPFTEEKPLTGTIRFASDDDMELNLFEVSSFLRYEITQNTTTVTPEEGSDEEPQVIPTNFILTLTDTPVPEPPTEPEPPTPEELLAQAKAGRDTAIMNSMEQAIYNGIDVETTYGLEHFTLNTNDQTLLLGIYGMVQQGVTQYPYHSISSSGDNNICVVYSDEDIGNIAVVAFGHITFHESYANMLLQWLERETDLDTVYTIEYGAALPEDLNEYLAMILQSAGIDLSVIPGYTPNADEDPNAGTTDGTDGTGASTVVTPPAEPTEDPVEEPVEDPTTEETTEPTV